MYSMMGSKRAQSLFPSAFCTATQAAARNAAGVDSVLVAGGVHAAELGVAQGAHESVDADRLAAFLSDFDAKPTHVVPGFTL